MEPSVGLGSAMFVFILVGVVAAGIAQGLELQFAAERARKYVFEAIRSAPGFGAGHGPLNHAHTINKMAI